jgi:hypothetical protein
MNPGHPNPLQIEHLETSRANDTAARAIAYLSPYLFWGVVGVIGAGVVLLG